MQWHTYSCIAAAAKLLQSCPTLCDPIDGSPPGSPVPGILQARILEWVAISFSNTWKWKWSRVWLLAIPPTRLLHSWDLPSKSRGMGCHCLLRYEVIKFYISKAKGNFHSVQFSCSISVWFFATPWTAAGQVPVHQKFPEFAQTHVHWVGDAIQTSHPLSSPSPTFNLSK